MIRVFYDYREIQQLRDRYAAEFIVALRDKFPDPRDATRMKAEVMIDLWWPMSSSQYESRHEELVFPGYP